MQNIDFSHRIARQRASKTGGSLPFIAEAKRPFLTSGTLLFSVAILAFAVGILSGFQIDRFSQVEKGVIRYPEGDLKREGSDRSAFANAAPSAETAANPEDGRSGTGSNPPSERPEEASSNAQTDVAAPAKGKYIIKIGTFKSADADRITNQLNNVPEIAQTAPVMCEGIQENVPDRYLAFRSRAGESENVFIGCFREEWRARVMLEVLEKSRLAGTANARLFEIE